RDGVTLLAAQRERILILARDAVLRGHVFGGLAHGLDAIQRLQRRIDEAPTHRGVLDQLIAGERRGRLAHHERRTRHRLDAAGDRQFQLTGTDASRGATHRIHTGAAQAIERHARHLDRQAGQQQAHARDVTVVFAGLVGAAEKYFVDLLGIQPRVARQQRLQRHRAEVVGTDAGERAAVAADRGADAIDNEYLAHHSAPSCLPWAASVRACSARSVSSSAACGTGVSTTLAANLIGQPVASMICSRVMPGWIDITVSSRVTASGSITHKSVTTTCGPLPGSPACWRASPPSM